MNELIDAFTIARQNPAIRNELLTGYGDMHVKGLGGYIDEYSNPRRAEANPLDP